MRYALELELLLDSEDSEELLDELDSEDSELALDELEDEDSELLLDPELALDSELLLDVLEDGEPGPVGLPLSQPASAPTPARAAPPESRIRNSRRSVRRATSPVAVSGVFSVFFSTMPPTSSERTPSPDRRR